MKILFQTLILLVAAGVGVGVGFIFREKTKPTIARPVVAHHGSSESQNKLTRKSKQPLAQPANDSSPLVTKLERDLSMSSGVTRWLYWLDALEKATLQDFPRLIRLAQGNSTAVRFVAARWAELNPRHMFDTIVSEIGSGSGFPANELAQTLFEEWPKRDPKGVIDALSNSNTVKASHWRMTVAGGIFANDVELGLRIMSEWNVDHYIPSMKGVAKWAAEDPRHAAEVTYDNPLGSASREMMKTIGKEWAKIDPAAALEFANSKSGELGSALAKSALNEWAGADLQAAADWLASTDTRTRSRLGSAFVEAWAKNDAAGALEWCALNLSGSSLAQAVGGVLKGAAQKDLAGAQALVASMSPSAARAEAAAAVAEKTFPDSWSEKHVSSEAIAWLKGLDPDTQKKAVEQVYWRWISTDADLFAEFLKTANIENLPSHIYSQMARNLARKNPAEALAWAAELPPDRGVAAGGEAFAEWRRYQSESAMKWLNALPETDSRREPFFENAVRTLAYESQAAEQLAAMNSKDRLAARKVIEGMSLPDDKRTKLLGMLQTK
ncbi:MAG TPA: hypothetical protein VJ063_20425 [Verrucomicrobiae bacterium]|nr:hypothetical protein [Verrucomicrobiae bacterium]